MYAYRRELPETAYVNGFRHVELRRFGGEQLFDYLSTGSGKLCSYNQSYVVANITPGYRPRLSLDKINPGSSTNNNALILPRQHLQFEIEEPLEVPLPDIVCALVEFQQSPNKHAALVDIVEDYGWQTGVLALGSLPQYSDLGACFSILKRFAARSSYTRQLRDDDKGFWGPGKWQYYHSPLPYNPEKARIVSDSWREMQELKGAFYLEKHYFELISRVLLNFRGGETWRQNYGYSAIQMHPVAITSGIINLILRSKAEEDLVVDSSEWETDSFINLSRYRSLVKQTSPNPVTCFLSGEVVLDAAGARDYNYRMHYCYPPRAAMDSQI